MSPRELFSTSVRELLPEPRDDAGAYSVNDVLLGASLFRRKLRCGSLTPADQESACQLAAWSLAHTQIGLNVLDGETVDTGFFGMSETHVRGILENLRNGLREEAFSPRVTRLVLALTMEHPLLGGFAREKAAEFLRSTNEQGAGITRIPEDVPLEERRRFARELAGVQIERMLEALDAEEGLHRNDHALMSLLAAAFHDRPDVCSPEAQAALQERIACWQFDKPENVRSMLELLLKQRVPQAPMRDELLTVIAECLWEPPALSSRHVVNPIAWEALEVETFGYFRRFEYEGCVPAVADFIRARWEDSGRPIKAITDQLSQIAENKPAVGVVHFEDDKGVKVVCGAHVAGASETDDIFLRGQLEAHALFELGQRRVLEELIARVAEPISFTGADLEQMETYGGLYALHVRGMEAAGVSQDYRRPRFAEAVQHFKG